MLVCHFALTGVLLTMYGNHSAGHSKKHLQYLGMKTVHVVRGRSGYGFTISGEYPCVLSCIVPGSPANLAGLKAGDCLCFVNGVSVSHVQHDDVVRMVGQSAGVLELKVAENCYSSDSSEDDYLPRCKSKYLSRLHSKKIVFDGKHHLPFRPSQHTNQGNVDGGRYTDAHYHRQRQHRKGVTLRPNSDRSTSFTSAASSLSEDKHDHCNWSSHLNVLCERNISIKTSTDSSTADVPGDRCSFSVTTLDRVPSILTSSISICRCGQDVHQNLVPFSTKVIMSPSSEKVSGKHGFTDNREMPASKVNPVDGVANEVTCSYSDVIETASAVVGYVGSMELPHHVHRSKQCLRQLRNTVKRMITEKKIHSFVAMKVTPLGVYISYDSSDVATHYAVDRLLFSGVCLEDDRFFSIVTLHNYQEGYVQGLSADDGEIDWGNSSCHLFMVAPELSHQTMNTQKAEIFGRICKGEGHCSHFPSSPTKLLLSIGNLCHGRQRSLIDSDIVRSLAFVDPFCSRQLHRGNKNDSGLGFCQEEPVCSCGHVCVIDMNVGYSAKNLSRNCFSSRSSGNIFSSHASVNSRRIEHCPTTNVCSRASAEVTQNSVSAVEIGCTFSSTVNGRHCFSNADHVLQAKLSPCVKLSPVFSHLSPSASGNKLHRDGYVEGFKQNMQLLCKSHEKLIQLKQICNGDVIYCSQATENTQVNCCFSEFSFYY